MLVAGHSASHTTRSPNAPPVSSLAPYLILSLLKTRALSIFFFCHLALTSSLTMMYAFLSLSILPLPDASPLGSIFLQGRHLSPLVGPPRCWHFSNLPPHSSPHVACKWVAPMPAGKSASATCPTTRSECSWTVVLVRAIITEHHRPCGLNNRMHWEAKSQIGRCLQGWFLLKGPRERSVPGPSPWFVDSCAVHVSSQHLPLCSSRCPSFLFCKNTRCIGSGPTSVTSL